MNLTAVPIEGRPKNARRITGWLAALFTTPGKLLVAYQDSEHVYVRWGRNKWARVEPVKRKRRKRRGA